MKSVYAVNNKNKFLVSPEVGKVSGEVIECWEGFKPAEKIGVEKDYGC